MSSSFISFILCGVLLLSIVHAQTQSCSNQCYDLKYYTCNICYTICTDNQTTTSNSTTTNSTTNTTTNATTNSTLTFISCKQLYCSHWETRTTYDGNTTSTQTYCEQWDWMYHNESQCTQSCCNHPSYTTFNTTTFAQCVAVNEELHATAVKIGIIIGCSVGGFFFIIFTICICRMCIDNIRSCFRDCCESCSFPSFRNNDVPYVENPIVHITDNNIDPKNKTIQLISVPPALTMWVEIEQNMKQSGSQYCSICLDGNMNCQTACGHKFHVMCFQDWIRKNPDCPLCKTHNFNEVKVYCEVCRNKETRINLSGGSILEFMKGNMVNCSECRSGEMRIKEIEY